MDLTVTGIRLADFRSYHVALLEDLGRMTIFVGPNAVGKSNLLEAIQLVTALSSFRGATSDQMIRWGCKESCVEAYLSDTQRELDVAVLLGGGSRRYRLNGKPISTASLRGTLPAVSFCPDDLSLVKGSPSVRRTALDALGSQLSANYRSVKRDYDKLIRQKNRLLKDEADDTYLASVNEVLSIVGAQLCRYRLQIISEMQEEFSNQYAETTGARERASLSYRLSWERDLGQRALGSCVQDILATDGVPPREEIHTAFDRALESATVAERNSKRTLVGPHRDSLDFLLDGHPASGFASQGQQRSLVICFKLTEFFLVEQRCQQRPILLLDDVMSEIDETRRSLLTEWLQKSTQTFITTTNLGYFSDEIIDAANIISLPFEETK